MDLLLGIAAVALASAAIAAILVYVAEELHHEHLNRTRER